MTLDVRKTVIDCLENNDCEGLVELIGRLINSSNVMAEKIRNLLKKCNELETIEDLISESVSNIFLKKDHLLSLERIDTGYLYSMIKNSLFDCLNSRFNREINFSSIDNQNGEGEESSFIENVSDEDEEDIARTFLSVDIQMYFYIFVNEMLNVKDFDTLCYLLSADKGVDRSLFLSDVKKKNTMDQRVKRLKEKIAKKIKKNCVISSNIEDELFVWNKVFDKFWSEICLERVNNSGSEKNGGFQND